MNNLRLVQSSALFSMTQGWGGGETGMVRKGRHDLKQTIHKFQS